MTVPPAAQPASPSLALPADLPPDGMLVGWSLEHEHARFPIGFNFGPSPHPERPDTLDPILLEGQGHLLTIAPTGAGKGVSCIIPALLRHPGPVIVIDPKGENYAVTARRRRELGQRVILLDPFGVTDGDEPPDRLNVLDYIDPTGQNAADDAAMLAELLVPEGRHDDPFWDTRARQLVTALILHVVSRNLPDDCRLSQLRDMVYLSPDMARNLAEDLRNSPSPPVRVMSAMLGMNMKDGPLPSILCFAQMGLDFMRSPQVEEAMVESTFDLKGVTDGHPLSIYIVIPPDKLHSHGQILRLWIGVLIGALLRRRRAPEHATLFILDEAAQLGRLPQLEQAVTLLRGYGLQTWCFWQDLSQLQLLYPRSWETIFNNCRVFQAFGIPNMRSADLMRSLTGFPDALGLLDLDADEMLLLISGDEAVIARRPNYLTDPVFKSHFDPNPFHLPAEVRELTPRRQQRRYRRPSVAKRQEVPGTAAALDDRQFLLTAINAEAGRHPLFLAGVVVPATWLVDENLLLPALVAAVHARMGFGGLAPPLDAEPEADATTLLGATVQGLKHAYPVNTYTHYMLDVSSRQNKARHRSAPRPRLRFPAMI